MGIEGDDIISAKCPDGYCCSERTCNFISDKASLCSENRDPDSVLCGRCKDEYSESMDSNACTKCDRHH